MASVSIEKLSENSFIPYPNSRKKTVILIRNKLFLRKSINSSKLYLQLDKKYIQGSYKNHIILLKRNLEKLLTTGYIIMA